MSMITEIRDEAHPDSVTIELALSIDEEYAHFLDGIEDITPDMADMYPDFDPHHPAERVEVYGSQNA